MKRQTSLVVLVMSCFLSGCVRRYTSMFLQSTPSQVLVTSVPDGSSLGSTPTVKLIDKSFVAVLPHRATYHLRFEHSGYRTKDQRVTLSRWAKTPGEGAKIITPIEVLLSACPTGQQACECSMKP
jgi:hypothetical protein